MTSTEHNESCRFMKLLDRRTLSVLVTVIAVGMVLAIIYLARAVIVIFAFSILFAYLINPHAKFLQRHSLLFKNLKGPHILQVYLVFLISLASVFHAFGPEFHGRPGRLAREIPTFADTVASGEIADSVGRNLGWTDAQTLRLRAFLQGQRANIESAKQAIQRSALEIVGAVLVIPVLAIFFLNDGDELANQFILLVSPSGNVGAVHSLAAELNVMLQHYIRAKVILGILSFLFSSAAMLVLGFPHPLALGVIAGILEFIPIAGWMMAAATIVSAGALAHSHWIWMLALLAAWRVCMDYAISPRVMGHELEIHPLLAIFTVMVGGAVGGIVGVYLSIPLVAALRVVWRRLPALKNAGVSS
jgi:predicted PurR-regulated permease PerM